MKNPLHLLEEKLSLNPNEQVGEDYGTGFANGTRFGILQGIDAVKSGPIFNRVWAMPSADTFSIKPIGDFVARYVEQSHCIVDPFARNHVYEKSNYTNDINPNTKAHFHKDARLFLAELIQQGIQSDLVILDPPWSPRQVSECYKELGMKVTQKDTQNASFMKEIKNLTNQLVKPQGIVLCFGWNSVGMGIKRNYTLEEVMLVAHGGVHNDSICIAERKNNL